MNLTNTSFTLSSSWTHQCNHTTTESVCDDGSTITRHPNLSCRKQAITSLYFLYWSSMRFQLRRRRRLQATTAMKTSG